MNQELWNAITKFDFDSPSSKYGFSLRLAHENYWTKSFTEQAIAEYKKFMYLAATSDFMVSPSEIVDIVWHQHLIFTKAYQEFCLLLGKQIQHIPSTHNKEEFQKFQQAKERTAKLYEEVFGTQPENIWKRRDMFEGLNLDKANYKIRTFILFGILACIGSTVPAYFVLQPLYLNIDNPYFILGLIAITVVIFLFLELYNRTKLYNMVAGFDKSSFIFRLQPFELVYLRTQKLSHVINGTINELIDDNIVKTRVNGTLELIENKMTTNEEQQQVITFLTEVNGSLFYKNLMKRLIAKPVFWNIANSMDAFQKYCIKSKKFGSLFYTNFTVLALLFLLAFTRLVTGVLRDKPVTLILLATLVLVILSVFFLKRLTLQLATTTIPDTYKKEILTPTQIEDNWRWRYFLLGTSVLTASFAPIVIQANTFQTNGSNCGTSCGSSCGSGCGSSCGSSCGGCGGH